MSAQEPSSHNSEHISAETKAATDDSQEPPAPPFFPEGSQDQGVFQQKPSVEDPEGIARRHRSSQPRSQKWRVFWISVVLLLLISGTATGIILVPKLYRIDTALNSATNQSLPHVKTSEQAIGIPSPTSLPTDLAGLGHLNLLLLASDTDAKFAGGGVLTQTDMVVRIDFTHHHVTMLSLPRDLWIPSDMGYCCNKLDEISLNETDNATTPLDVKLHGFAHTVATVEQDFHIPINAYAWVGLDGFIKVIDTLGGVDIDVLHPIVDDTYPADITNPNNPYDYQRIYIAPGPQHLDGETALEYVRSRHSDLLGDVGRTARQQELLLALKQKLDNREIFVHLEEIATDLQGSVLTSLSIEQVLELASFARVLSSHDFTQLALGLPDYGYGAMIDSPEGNIWVEEPLFSYGVNDLGYIERSTRDDPHTINALPGHLRCNFKRQSRWDQLAGLLERALSKSLLIIGEQKAALLFVLV